MLILWPMDGCGGEREEGEKGELKWKSEMGKLDQLRNEGTIRS